MVLRRTVMPGVWALNQRRVPALRRARWLVLAMAVALGAAGNATRAFAAHGGGATGLAVTGPLVRPEGGLLILCGTGLRVPMEALRKEFERRHHTKIRVVYGGSPCLLAQLSITAPNRLVDLYVPGEEYYAQQAVKRGLVSAHRPLSYFIPVIMVRKGNPKGIHTLQDLAQPGIRVGVGEPKTCAIGHTTQELLKKHGLTQRVMRNVVVRTPMAPELSNAVKIGSIDAAINWDAVAAPYTDAADIITIPPRDNVIVCATIGIAKASRAVQLARQFLDFATGKDGQAIVERARFTVDLKRPVFPHRGS